MDNRAALFFFSSLPYQVSLDFYSIVSLVVSVIVMAAIFSILFSIWLDFKFYGGRNHTRRRKRSAVATGTMFLFFCVYYLALRFQIGIWAVESLMIRLLMIGGGLFLIVSGAVINIWGRMKLKQNWADHIKIYDDHTLITIGPFRYVRHPLYSSLFLMFYGGALLYASWIAVILTSLIFVPMMYYRARQEEVLLRQTFQEYEAYAQKAGRFLPKSVFGYQGGIMK